MTTIAHNLITLFTTLYGTPPISVTKLPGSGSYRSYYRLQGLHESVLGAHNEDIRENEAFISFTNHFYSEGLPVPRILASDPASRIYLITDLGDTTLYQVLTNSRNAEPDGSSSRFSPELMEIYKKAICWLPVFQVKCGQTLDYSVCYPRSAFDRQSMMWDLNYFKYYFLKLAKIPFDEQDLENDFIGLCDILLEVDADFFLFRDFQSRNIMVFNNEPWFIDYQGGRKGALQYDIASLLTDGKADIPMADRDELLMFYLDQLERTCPVDRQKFLKYYYAFALIRILQALGAYGFRGYYEHKLHFLQSIPFALRNLRYFRAKHLIDFDLPELISVIDMMVDSSELNSKQSVDINHSISHNNNNIESANSSDNVEKKLTVTVHSFSYKKKFPADESGNGGGFVFDCRALPNPGRYDEFRLLNGKDQPVIEFLEKEPAVQQFLENTFALVNQSVTTYLDRKFDHLMVSYGCTGGQHRSVYCAEQLAMHLKLNPKINTRLIHIEQ
jgi:aminoglycoside/choline kinase family phosphotransferase